MALRKHQITLGCVVKWIYHHKFAYMRHRVSAGLQNVLQITVESRLRYSGTVGRGHKEHRCRHLMQLKKPGAF